MANQKCKFCEKLAMTNEIEERSNSYVPPERKTVHEYTVALVSLAWIPSHGKESAGRMVSFEHQGVGYKLKFCPECGRKFAKNEVKG